MGNPLQAVSYTLRQRFTCLHKQRYYFGRFCRSCCAAVGVQRNDRHSSATEKTVVPDAGHSAKVLTAREKLLLLLIGAGKRGKEIAASLSNCIHTVNRHRSNILEKLRANHSPEALKVARMIQLI